MTRRLKFGLVALVALAASAFFTAPALADTQPDPQLTNMPYLAWRGEEVRLVKCDPNILAGLDQAQRQQVAQSAQFEDIFVDFLLVDWSGDPNVVKPQLEPGTVSMFFRSFDGAPCVAATVVSEKAGLAQFKLVVTANLSLALGTPFANVPEVVTLKHDFNVAWMNIASATASVVQGGTTDVAGGSGNNLQVLVTGQIPMLSNYGELGLGDSITMPNDWAALANAMATFQDPLNPNPAMFWDVHDGLSWTEAAVEGHGGQSACPEFRVPQFFDAVDSCSTHDPFDMSRVWQDMAAPAFGPFDPERPSQTLLSNGVLDAGDAPMPAARVDWAIAPNSGAPGDISGVGSLSPSLKVDVYNRAPAPHEFYAPFYAFWIPSTYPALASAFFGEVPPIFVNEASGVTGPVNLTRSTTDCAGSTLIDGIPSGGGNNFNGFLACGLYLPWLFAKNLQCGPGGSLTDPNDPFGDCSVTSNAATGCLPVANTSGETPTGADIPSLDQKSVVYTDEHGEARVNFLPGTEFFFLNLPGVAINANGGCDLANISTLGTANVTATVRYPFEPVTARPVVSNTITKTVTSAFSKTITCYPKGSQPEEQNAAICVAEAHDITGAPVVGETVCFFADFNAEDIQYFAGSIPGTNITIGDEGRNSAAESQGLRRICPYTDSNGRAAVEVFDSNPTTVDVQALFVDEGILRSLHVTFPITGQQGPANGTKSQTSTSPTGPVSTGPGPGSTQTPTGSKPGVSVKIASLKVTRVSRTKATVALKVTGPAGKVPVRIRFAAVGKVAKHSARTVSVVRVVKTNAVVKLRNLRTPNAARLTTKASLIS